jgi:TPR repeat protein
MSNLQEGLNAFHAEDYAKAFSILKPIAEAGDPEAQCLIANLYNA